MKPQIIAQGAEAILTKDNNQVIKQRIKKSYRLPIIDERLRKSRTKKEAKLLDKLQNIIPVPKLIQEDLAKKEIIMEFIDGKKLSEHLEKLNLKDVCKQIGNNLALLHDADIIHGDLTTSNMILKDNQVYFIDFGLSSQTHKIEARAVDLHLIKQALEAKHFTIWEQAFKEIIKNYNSKDKTKTLAQLEKVEKRGRYKH